jgi:hypothetical protein
VSLKFSGVKALLSAYAAVDNINKHPNEKTILLINLSPYQTVKILYIIKNFL